MKKLLLISAFALSLPTVTLAAPTKTSTTIALDYENPQQLIKNYYAAQEFCRSSTKENDPETTIMCNYRDAADTKLNQLGYCFGDNDEQSMAEREWKKCSQGAKKTTTVNNATTTQATTVSKAVINEAIQDIKNICYQQGFDGLTQHILNCYTNSSNDQIQKCILEDISFINFYGSLMKSLKEKTGETPELPAFLSNTAITYREKEYYIPRFGSTNKTILYFKEGITPVSEELGTCTLKIMDEAKQLQLPPK